MIDTKLYLIDQMNTKNEENLRLFRAKFSEKKHLEENLKKQNESNHVENSKKALSYANYRKSIEEQMQNIKNEDFMSKEEKKINRDLLKEL